MSRSSRSIPPDKWKPSRRQQAEEVNRLLDASPEGLTGEDISRELEVGISTTRRAVRDARVIRGVDDVLTIITERVGNSNEPHIYKLIGTYNEGKGPIEHKGCAEIETRAETLWYMVQSLARGADGRTSEGRRARFIEESLRHMMKTLQLMRDSDKQTALF